MFDLLGYSAEEMQGRSLSEFLQNKEAMQVIFGDDKNNNNETKKKIQLKFFNKNTEQIVLFETEFFPFINIFNKDVDSYVCTHRILLH